MIEKTVQIDVPRPLSQTFSFVSDLENNPKWISGLISTHKISAGAIQKGTRLINKFDQRGGIEYAETITEFVPEQSFSFEIHVPNMPIVGKFKFRAMDSTTTRISFTETANPQSFVYKVVKPVVSIVMSYQLKKDFKKLKKILSASN